MSTSIQYIGWNVEWSSSFRSFLGVVVDIDSDDKLVIFELTDCKEVHKKEKEITKRRPNLKEFIKYQKNMFLKKNDVEWSDDASHEYVLAQLDRISNRENSMLEEKKAAVRDEIHCRYLNARKKSSTKVGQESPTNQAPNESEEEDDDEDNEDEEEDDEDDDEEDEEEEDDDEEDESESESEEDDEEDSSDEDDSKIDLKVHILPHQDIRGFCIALNSSGLSKVLKSISKDYINSNEYSISTGRNKKSALKPKLFYRDQEGDVIHILSVSDLKYSHRAAKALHRSGDRKHPFKLKLFAEIVDTSAKAAPPVVSTAKNSAQSTPTSAHRVRNDSFDNDHKSDSKQSSRDSPNVARTSQSSTVVIENRTVNYDSRYPYGDRSQSPAHTPSQFDAQQSQQALQPLTQNDSVALSSSSATRYDVIWKKGELLGAGSFGEVFSGINLTNGERIAVKEVTFQNYHATSTKYRRQQEQARALQQEVRILSALDHPNIIKYLGTECTKNTLRIFLELANNGTVKDALNEFGAFPESLIRRYTFDIVEGLSFLHGKRFIHRDIKPTNLLISHGVVKLGDFGCSSGSLEGDDDNGASQSGLHGTIIGTAVYMAPEVMRAEDAQFGVVEAEGSPSREKSGGVSSSPDPQGYDSSFESYHRNNPSNKNNHNDTATRSKKGASPSKPKSSGGGYGKKADMWSLGITLCEMATGSAPYKNAAAAIYSICVSKHYPTFPEGFSRDAHEFLSRCLVENPRNRANCTELRAHPFLAAQPIDEVRAQTALHLQQSAAHTSSTVKLCLPADDSFFDSRGFHSFSSERPPQMSDDSMAMSDFHTARQNRPSSYHIQKYSENSNNDSLSQNDMFSSQHKTQSSPNTRQKQYNNNNASNFSDEDGDTNYNRRHTRTTTTTAAATDRDTSTTDTQMLLMHSDVSDDDDEGRTSTRFSRTMVEGSTMNFHTVYARSPNNKPNKNLSRNNNNNVSNYSSPQGSPSRRRAESKESYSRGSNSNNNHNNNNLPSPVHWPPPKSTALHDGGGGGNAPPLLRQGSDDSVNSVNSVTSTFSHMFQH